jgi:hypothetical protein
MPRSTATLSIEGRRAAGLAILCALTACAEVPVTPPEAPLAAPEGVPVDFAYETTDGGVLAAASLRGRVTVLAFVATYDLVSQAQVKVLGLVRRDHVPRVNVAVLVVGPPENKPLAIAFGQSLSVPFPVAIAGSSVLEGRGPFGAVREVPTIVILDRDGRIVFRHTGPMEKKPLHAELERHGGRAALPVPGLSGPAPRD